MGCVGTFALIRVFSDDVGLRCYLRVQLGGLGGLVTCFV